MAMILRKSSLQDKGFILRLNDLRIITDKILMGECKKGFFFLSLSLFFHIGLVLSPVIWKSDRKRTEKLFLMVEWVDLNLAEDRDVKENQIVEQEENPDDGMIPKRDYRLSQSHRDVLKETKAEKKGVFENVKDKQESPLETEKTKTVKRDSRSLDHFKPRLFDFKAFNDGFIRSAESNRPDSFQSDTVHSYLSEEKSFSSEVRMSQSDDYLKDVALGSQTLLRTREFIYYSYYSRIQKKLRQYWEPRVKIKITKALKKGRKVAGVNDMITRLVIILNHSGELIKIRVRNSSGSNDLDAAAIEAFWEASPFPNPPEGLVNELGEVRINWDFVLET